MTEGVLMMVIVILVVVILHFVWWNKQYDERHYASMFDYHREYKYLDLIFKEDGGVVHIIKEEGLITLKKEGVSKEKYDGRMRDVMVVGIYIENRKVLESEVMDGWELYFNDLEDPYHEIVDKYLLDRFLVSMRRKRRYDARDIKRKKQGFKRGYIR